MFQTDKLKMLKVWGVLVLVFALWTGCGDDDEGTKTKTKTKAEKEKEIKDSDLYKAEAKKLKEAEDKAKKSSTELAAAKKKLDALRKKDKIYVWGLVAGASTGNLGGVTRAVLDTSCGDRAINNMAGKPDAVKNHIAGDKDRTHVTKSLLLSHGVSNFRVLGAHAIAEGATPLSIAMDEVWGISKDGKKSKKLADTYEDFYDKEWMNTLKDAGVDATGINANNAYWLGGFAKGALDRTNSALGTCNNFVSAADGEVGAATARHIANTAAVVQNSVKTVNKTSPLKAFQGAANAVVKEGTTWAGCNEMAKRLCISFPIK